MKNCLQFIKKVEIKLVFLCDIDIFYYFCIVIMHI